MCCAGFVRHVHTALKTSEILYSLMPPSVHFLIFARTFSWLQKQRQLAIEHNERLQREYDLKLNAARSRRERSRIEHEPVQRSAPSQSGGGSLSRSKHRPQQPTTEESKSSTPQIPPKPQRPEPMVSPAEYACRTCTYINKLSYFRGELRSSKCEICGDSFEKEFVVCFLWVFVVCFLFSSFCKSFKYFFISSMDPQGHMSERSMRVSFWTLQFCFCTLYHCKP